MHDFNYRFVKKHFHAESLFNESDSLTYEINQKVLMKNFKDKHLLDFSNYP